MSNPGLDRKCVPRCAAAPSPEARKACCALRMAIGCPNVDNGCVIDLKPAPTRPPPPSASQICAENCSLPLMKIRRDNCCIRKMQKGCPDSYCLSQQAGGGGVVSGGGTQPLPVGRDDCALWPACNVHPDPLACCRQKPTTCYDPDCLGGAFRGTPVLRPPPPNPNECARWPPCQGTAYPQACCMAKPAGCDPWCARAGLGGGFPQNPSYVYYTGPTYPGSMGPAQTITYGTQLDGECSAWPPCSAQPNPGLCCASKRPGCDPSCNRYVDVAFDGNTFNAVRDPGQWDESDDDMWGIDAGYAGGFAR